MISHSGDFTSDNGLTLAFPGNLVEPACFAGRLPTNAEALNQFVGTFPANMAASTKNTGKHSTKAPSEVEVEVEREGHSFDHRPKGSNFAWVLPGDMRGETQWKYRVHK